MRITNIQGGRNALQASTFSVVQFFTLYKLALTNTAVVQNIHDLPLLMVYNTGHDLYQVLGLNPHV